MKTFSESPSLFGLYNKSLNVCFIVNNDSKIYFNPSFLTNELSCFNVGKTIAFDNNKFCQKVLDIHVLNYFQ